MSFLGKFATFDRKLNIVLEKIVTLHC